METRLAGLSVEGVEHHDSLIRVTGKVDEPGPFTSGHFPGTPIVPAFVLVSWLLGLTREFEIEVPKPVSFESVKFLAPLRGGEQILIDLILRSGLLSRFEMRTRNEMISRGTLAVTLETA